MADKVETNGAGMTPIQRRKLNAEKARSGGAGAGHALEAFKGNLDDGGISVRDYRAAVAAGQAGGRLLTDIQFLLHSREAITQITGKPREGKKPGVRGIGWFVHQVRLLENESRKSDPWADWYLVRLEHRLEQSVATMEGQARGLAGILGSNPYMRVGLSYSDKPVLFEYDNVPVYANLFSAAVVMYDHLVLAVLSAKRAGLLNLAESTQWFRDVKRPMTQIFSSVERYQKTEVTREHVQMGAILAQQAEALMGEVPEAILDGTTQPKFWAVNYRLVAVDNQPLPQFAQAMAEATGPADGAGADGDAGAEDADGTADGMAGAAAAGQVAEAA